MSGAEAQRVGPYHLVEEIGVGGFGIVYRARQFEPVSRYVALKIIKPGMDTRQVAARFETERQALAIMEHPNIARFFDAGRTDDDRLYFVMELVEGWPLTEFCQRQALSLAQRLELFCDICEAVNHAHKKGIIHRDLKPTNILVASAPDLHPAGCCKIIDFGIAKATQQVFASDTLLTQDNQLIGTPEYMSPERVSSGWDVDTRSDVYSLGVILFEMLTGTTPFWHADDQSFEEIRKRVREENAPRPSAQLRKHSSSDSSDSDTHVLQSIPADLDWIVLKAIEKDRERRYQSADDLALDIRRYLSDQPIAALPPSALYRAKKFVHRNRLVVAAAAAVSVAILVGSAVSLFLAFEAHDARDEMRSTFSSSDFLMASSLLEAEDVSGAVAHLCRALRNNPDNVPARHRLWSLLVGNSFPVPLLPPIEHEKYCWAQFTPDGSRLITCSGDNAVQVWNSDNGQPTTEPYRFSDPVHIMIPVDPSGQRFAIGSATSTLQVFGVETGKPVSPILRIGTGGGAVWAGQLNHGGTRVIGSSRNGTVAAWETESGESIWKLEREIPARTCSFSPDGTRAIAGWE